MLISEILATYRITRLVTKDGITQRPRDAILAWALRPSRWGRARHPKVAELIECPWCVSAYAAAVVLVLRCHPAGRVLLTALALSAAAGTMAETVELLHEERPAISG